MDEAHIEQTRRFDALFRAHSRDIIAFCGWRSDTAADAEDAVAQVFLIAWRRLDELPEANAARLWLYATACRVIANQRRSSRRRLALAATSRPLERGSAVGTRRRCRSASSQGRAPGGSPKWT